MAIVINNTSGIAKGPYTTSLISIDANSSYSAKDSIIPDFAKDTQFLSDVLEGIITLTFGNTEIGKIGAFDVLNKFSQAAAINRTGSESSTYSHIIGGVGPTGNAATANIDANGQLRTVLVGNDGLYKAAIDSVGRMATNANVTFPETIYKKEALLNSTSKAMNVNGSSSNVSFKFTPSTDVYYLEQLSLLIEDQGDFLPSNFGALAVLTNGLQINIKSKGQTFTIATLKDNADIYGIFTEAPASQSISVLLQSNRNSYWAGWRLQNRIALDPALGDYVEFLVKDNLTGLNTLNAYASVWRTLG